MRHSIFSPDRGGATPVERAAGRDGAPHAHHHDHTGAGPRALLTALILIVLFMIGEVTAGLAAHSLALLADAAHMLTDAAALLAALGAARLAARPAQGVWTFGFSRAEVLSAAGNGASLLVLGAFVLVEALRRLAHPGHVHPVPLLVVAVIGLAVNGLATWVLTRADRSSMAVEGAFRHVLTDAYAFGATFVAGLVVLTTGLQRADALASLVVVGLMVRAGVTLLRASGRVLLEAAPDNVDLAEVRSHLLGTEHVLDVHDLHAWTVATRLPALSAHVVVQDCCFAQGHAPRVLDALQHCLAGHFDVEHSTFQLEPAGHAAHEAAGHA